MAIDALAKKKTEDKGLDSDNPYIRKFDSDREDGINLLQNGICGCQGNSAGVYESTVKLIADKVLSFLGLVLLCPVFLFISIVIFIDDPGPIFFTQKRVGKDGHYFMLHKFRSMKMATPHDIPTHMLENPDKYITKAGRFLRKTSLDELPQIWDIFRGKMSVVGPRPALWNQEDLVAEREKYRANNILPGLTGLAQTKGRDELEIPDKAKFDGEYTMILHRGGMGAAYQDLKICCITVLSVLRHDGVVEGGTGRLKRGQELYPEDGFQMREQAQYKVHAFEAGFEDYGCFKHFDIDKKLKKSVLITGVGSYIGESFKSYCETHYPNISINAIDMIDESWREADFGIYDTVFHVAGIAHADVGKVSEAEQREYYKINTDLAIETARKAKASGVKQFIFMSSMIVYGESAPYGTDLVIDENTIPSPANFYGDSKWQADKGVRELSTATFHVAVLRVPMVYGCGSKGNYPALAKLAKKLFVFPDVDNSRSMLYIGNLCEFVALLTLSGEGGIYFPQNNSYTRTSTMVEAISAVGGKKIKKLRVLNVALAIAQKIPGKVGCLVNKAFGNQVYDQMLSGYEGLDYQIYSLEESIVLTEAEPGIALLATEPLVSVITAAYNCADTIAETIESVLAQTYNNWEMVIVNDASTDNTLDVVSAYTNIDERIRLISLKANSGAATARNKAIQNSKGRYIAVLDSDDLWKPKKLERQIAFMVQNGYAFTFTAYETFHDSSDKSRVVFKAPKSVTYKQYLKNTIIGNLTVVMDKDLIKDFHIQSGYLEDVLTWMYYLKKGHIAYGLNENLASYRVALGSKSGNKLKNAKRYYNCLQEQNLSFLERVFDEVCYLFHAAKKRVFGRRILSKGIPVKVQLEARKGNV